jgi:hypothetical protein
MLRGNLFAIDRELKNIEVRSVNATFSEALGRRKRTKKAPERKTTKKNVASKKQATAQNPKQKQTENQKITDASKVKSNVNDVLGAAGNAVKQVVDTALGTTPPTPSQDSPKPTSAIPALTSDTILEQLEAQTKMLENMVQKMRPAVRLLEEWEEDEEIDLIRPKLNAIIGAIHRFKTILETV